MVGQGRVRCTRSPCSGSGWWAGPATGFGRSCRGIRPLGTGFADMNESRACEFHGRGCWRSASGACLGRSRWCEVHVEPMLWRRAVDRRRGGFGRSCRTNRSPRDRSVRHERVRVCRAGGGRAAATGSAVHVPVIRRIPCGSVGHERVRLRVSGHRTDALEVTCAGPATGSAVHVVRIVHLMTDSYDMNESRGV